MNRKRSMRMHVACVATLVMVVAMVGANVLQTAAPPARAAGQTPTAAPTPTAKPPARVLFLHGDSPWFVSYYFPILAASGEPPIIVANLGIRVSGATLGRYLSHEEAQRQIHNRDWDTVVLYENSADLWWGANEIPEAARQLAEEIQSARGEAVLFMPWAKAGEYVVPQIGEMAEVYVKTAAELGIKMAPVGLAFEQSLKERPELDLYSFDGFRANAYGAYLTLCVLYATIFQRSPVGLAYRMQGLPSDAPAIAWRNPDGWQMSDDDAAFLQRIAWETVQDYQAGK